MFQYSWYIYTVHLLEWRSYWHNKQYPPTYQQSFNCFVAWRGAKLWCLAAYSRKDKTSQSMKTDMKVAYLIQLNQEYLLMDTQLWIFLFDTCSCTHRYRPFRVGASNNFPFKVYLFPSICVYYFNLSYYSSYALV